MTATRTPLDLPELRRLAEKATPGPWRWRTDQNGEGSVATHLDSQTGKWERCEFYCFGWDADDETHRGSQHQPGHEHLTDPIVISGSGWHGSGDVNIEDADAAFIAAFDPTTAKALLSEIVALRRVRDAARLLLAILDNPMTPRSRSAVVRAELRLALKEARGAE